MFVPIEIFKEVGLLDEELFLYYTDVDFAIRARKNGYYTYGITDIKVFHKAGMAMKSIDIEEIFKNIMIDKLVFFKKNSRFIDWITFFPYLIFMFSHQLYNSLFNKNFGPIKGIIKGLFISLFKK
jgi:GT2 family glycosyltransferase